MLGLSLAVLVAVVVPPLVNLGRYQHRIAETMSRSLGRPTTMSSVRLRLLPSPALVLSDVVVNEDPAFGAEPALRAPTVVAELRLPSLWRGRLEISRVELSEASINLVRDGAGRWNVGTVLLQASHVQNAPTAQRHSGAAPRFPYIEITDSRVNVKQGAEKLPYSLLNANLSMWLAEPELWQLRMDAQPVRTDLPLGLSDTGLVRIDGTLHRATALGKMPLALHADWANAPLGQASRLLLAQDGGWRGDLHGSADVSGDLDSLQLVARLNIGNLHREEFTPLEPFTVDATCRASYSRAAQSISGIACNWPVGKAGQLRLIGGLGLLKHGWQPDLEIAAHEVPAEFLLAAAGLARSDFVPEFQPDGVFGGTFRYAGTERGALLSGQLDAPAVQLDASGLETPLLLNAVRILVAAGDKDSSPVVLLTAAPVNLGGTAPVEVSAQLAGGTILLHASGSAALARLEELGQATHLLPRTIARMEPQGVAEFDVTRAIGWRVDSNTPEGAVSGSLRLRNARYMPDFLPGGVDLPAATATFAPGEIVWNVPEAIFHHMPVQLIAHDPMGCKGPGCVTRFRAAFATLDAGALGSALVNEGATGHLLDALLSRLGNHSDHWPVLSGTVQADTLKMGKLTARNANASVEIAGGHASLKDLGAQALGGQLSGEGAVSVVSGKPRYTMRFALVHGSPTAAGGLFGEDWGAGQLDLSSDMQLTGMRPSDLLASVTGTFRAEWLRGGLGSGTPLAQFARWTSEGEIKDQALVFTAGTLTGTGTGTRREPSVAAPVPVLGRIAFDRNLDLELGKAPDTLILTGSLAHPEAPVKTDHAASSAP
jgi:hypothetical protein